MVKGVSKSPSSYKHLPPTFPFLRLSVHGRGSLRKRKEIRSGESIMSHHAVRSRPTARAIAGVAKLQGRGFQVRGPCLEKFLFNSGNNSITVPAAHGARPSTINYKRNSWERERERERETTIYEATSLIAHAFLPFTFNPSSQDVRWKSSMRTLHSQVRDTLGICLRYHWEFRLDED